MNDDNEKLDPTYENKKLEVQLQEEKQKKYNKPERSSKRLKVSHILEEEDKNLVNRPQVLKKKSTYKLDENLVEEVKQALMRETTRAGKIEILTTLPRDVSIRQMMELFGVSYRMGSKAKKLRKTDGYKMRPKKRAGRKLADSAVQKVKDFYCSDQASRMMPGKNDFVSVKTDSGKEQIQKRLLLYTIPELHAIFIEKFPNVIVSVSKFRKLRPKECIIVDSKAGLHNVCVCKIHQNVRLKFKGLSTVLKEKGCIYTKTYHDALNSIT